VQSSDGNARCVARLLAESSFSASRRPATGGAARAQSERLAGHAGRKTQPAKSDVWEGGSAHEHRVASAKTTRGSEGTAFTGF
jgi:hypothetical protein